MKYFVFSPVWVSHYPFSVCGISLYFSCQFYWAILTCNIGMLTVYNIMIWYMLQNDYYSKHPSPHIVVIFFFFWWELLIYTLSFQIHNTELLTTGTMLYTTSPELIYNWKSVPFDHLHPFLPSTTHCLRQLPVCSEFVFLDSIFKSNHIEFVFLCLTWLI